MNHQLKLILCTYNANWSLIQNLAGLLEMAPLIIDFIKYILIMPKFRVVMKTTPVSRPESDNKIL